MAVFLMAKKLITVLTILCTPPNERWTQLGNGDYGPMKAMMFGRLKFTGPKAEAMSVMTPFGEFLKLAGLCRR